MRSSIDIFREEDTNSEFIKTNYERMARKKQLQVFTWKLDDKPMAYFGVHSMDFGVGLVWVRLNNEARKNNIELIKTINYITDDFCVNKLKLHKLQAVVELTNVKAIRFAEFLGFKREGVIKDYGQLRTTHILYGRTICYQQ